MLARCVANGGKSTPGGRDNSGRNDSTEHSQDHMTHQPLAHEMDPSATSEEEFFSFASDEAGEEDHHFATPFSTAQRSDGSPSSRSPRLVVKINQPQDLTDYTEYDADGRKVRDATIEAQPRKPKTPTPLKQRRQSIPTPQREDTRTIAATPDSELRKKRRAQSTPKKLSSTPKKKKTTPEEDAPVLLVGSARRQQKEAGVEASTPTANRHIDLTEERIPASPLAKQGVKNDHEAGVSRTASSSNVKAPQPTQAKSTPASTYPTPERELHPDQKSPSYRRSSISNENKSSQDLDPAPIAKPSKRNAKTKQPDLPFVKLNDGLKTQSVSSQRAAQRARSSSVSSRRASKTKSSKKQTTLPFTPSQSSAPDDDDCRIVGVSPRIKKETPVKPAFLKDRPVYDTISDSGEAPTVKSTQRLQIKSRFKPGLVIKQESSDPTLIPQKKSSKSATAPSPQRDPVVLDLTLLSSSESDFDSDEYDFEAISKLIESSPCKTSAKGHTLLKKTTARNEAKFTSTSSATPEPATNKAEATQSIKLSENAVDDGRGENADRETTPDYDLSGESQRAGPPSTPTTKSTRPASQQSEKNHPLSRGEVTEPIPAIHITGDDEQECHDREASRDRRSTSPSPIDTVESRSRHHVSEQSTAHILRPAYGHKVPFPEYDPTGRTGRYQPHHREELDLKGILKPTDWSKGPSRLTKSKTASQRGKSGEEPPCHSQQDPPEGVHDASRILGQGPGNHITTSPEAANVMTPGPEPPSTPDRSSSSKTVRHNPRHGFGSKASPVRSKAPCPPREKRDQPPVPRELSPYGKLLQRAKEATPGYKTRKAMKPTIDRLKRRILQGTEPSPRQYMGVKDYRAVEAEMVRRGLNKAQQDTFLAELVTEYSRILAGSSTCLKSMWLKVMDDLYEECAQLEPSEAPRTSSKGLKEETKPMSSFEALLAHGQGCTDDSSVSSDCSDSESDCKLPPLTRGTQERQGLLTPDTSPLRRPQTATSPTAALSKKKSHAEATDAPATPSKSPKRIKMVSKVVREAMRRKLALGRVNKKDIAWNTRQMVDYHTQGWKKRLIDLTNAKEDDKLSEKAKKRRKLDQGWYEVISKMMVSK